MEKEQNYTNMHLLSCLYCPATYVFSFVVNNKYYVFFFLLFCLFLFCFVTTECVCMYVECEWCLGVCMRVCLWVCCEVCACIGERYIWICKLQCHAADLSFRLPCLIMMLKINKKYILKKKEVQRKSI